jgi:hypothetical protein
VKRVTSFWVTGYGLGATNWKKSKISNQKIKNFFWGCEQKPLLNICPLPVSNLFASKTGKKDFRLSSAAFGLFVFQFGEADD